MIPGSDREAVWYKYCDLPLKQDTYQALSAAWHLPPWFLRAIAQRVPVAAVCSNQLPQIPPATTAMSPSPARAPAPMRSECSIFHFLSDAHLLCFPPSPFLDIRKDHFSDLPAALLSRSPRRKRAGRSDVRDMYQFKTETRVRWN